VLLFDPQRWKLDPESWKRWHRPWFLLCAIVALAACAWYGLTWWQSPTLPGGSSKPGLVAGGLAGLLFLYLFSYALRKLIPFKLWFSMAPTKFWLAQHIWFGLLTLPLVWLHSGLFTRWGGLLTVVLLLVYLGVFLSGVWGLYTQHRMPRTLLQDVPDETIYSQIPVLSSELRNEAELLVLATCGPPVDNPNGALEVLKENLPRVRAARAGKGAGLLRVLPSQPLPDTEPLRHYFHSVIDPYLRSEASYRSKLRLRARLENDFEDLELRINPKAQPVVAALKDLCERRKQFDEQSRLHFWLHNWILFHLSLSAILLVLLCWHAVTAIWYW
jgi:hypothetical protein